MLGIFFCTISQVKQQKQHLKVLQATSQEWIAGLPCAAGRINYKLTIKILTDQEVKFDFVWVAGRKLKIMVENGGQNPESKSAEDGVITLLASHYERGPE
jgi:hypothetical protein